VNNNLALRVLSLFLAFTVWFFVSAPRREPVSERAFAAPVSIVRMPRDLVITTPVPDTVSVRLRGRVSDLRSLSSQNLEVTLDVSWVTPGDAVITLSPQAMSVPPQIDVVSIEPMKLRFHVEALRQTVVPIRPFLIGQPPPGYVAGDATLVPDHALVSGPASQIRNVTEVATERIIMSGRSETFVQNVGVVSDSSLVRIIEPLITQVTVPVNPEIGPVAPASATTDTSTDDASAEKPAVAKPPEKTQEKTPPDQKRRHKREQ
jgi:YbbR domain-containing protein